MASKSTLKTAAQLLDRFFRDAEGRTNRQIDVYFAVQDMDLTDKAEEALAYLQSRGLLNLFGSDIAFLTDKGVKAVVDEADLGKLPKEARDFVQKPAPGSSAPPAPAASPPARSSGGSGTTRPERPQLTHIDLDGGEFTLQLAWSCKVGRADDNEVRINDKRASKHHAEIFYQDGRYYLRDLESANGTLLNGDYALEPIPLKHDDEVVIGRTMLLFQAPELIPEPEPLDAVEEAPDEPGTLLTDPPPPTERPGPASERPAASAEVASIRVVKGTAVAPPSAQTPAPQVADADLFAEPPTRAGDGPALFGDEPPTHVPGDDLFADDVGLEETPAMRAGRPGANLFEDAPPAAGGDDLFADDAPAAGDDDLFGRAPSRGGDDLFSEAPAPAPEPTPPPPVAPSVAGPPDPSGGLELEPLASAPELTQAPARPPSEPLDRGDTVAEAPVDDLWADDDTPASGGPPGEDGDTMMMTRDAFVDAQAQAAAVAPPTSGGEDLPHWATTEDTSHPGFSDATGPIISDAAEALPEASPSLAMPAVEPTPPAVEAFYAKLEALEGHLAADADAAEALDAVRRLRSDARVRAALIRLES